MGDTEAPTEKEIIVVVAGSRGFTDDQFIFDTLDKLSALFAASGMRIAEVVSGNARGPDKIGEAWGIARGIEVTVMPADWDKLGKQAGMVRNAEMADYGHAAIIFWDGESRGTANMISNMKMRDKPCHVIRV